MKTKYFYNAFNILYDLVKESLGIFQKEELYRQLFQAIYVMSGDALYDNDSIRKITSGNQTIHLRAVKKLHTPEGFEKFRRDIERVCLTNINSPVDVANKLLEQCEQVSEETGRTIKSSFNDDTPYQISRAVAAVLIFLNHADYASSKGKHTVLNIDFMRLGEEQPLLSCPKFITNIPNAAVDRLVGRIDEINEVYQEIVEGDGKLMVTGVGGLGKTVVVQQFLNKLQNTPTEESQIEKIAWIPYDNHDICLSMKQALHLKCDLEDVWQAVQDLCADSKGRLLFVIDNIENIGNDEFLGKLSMLPCRVLITSRQKILRGFNRIMYLPPLKMAQCRDLFYQHYQYAERDNEVLNDIIDLTAKLTIMIVFLAKVAYLEELSLHELYAKLVECGFKLSEEDVSCEHEKMQNDETIIRQMCILFSLVNYSEEDKRVLTFISLIPNLQFDFPKAKKWFNIKKNSRLLGLYNMGMLEHVINGRKHIYWMHSVIAAAVREQQKEQLYSLSRPFVSILSEELNTGPVFGKEYEKAYLIPFSWSVADIMENHWGEEEDTDFLSSLFHVCFACSNYSLCEKLIDTVIEIQKDTSKFSVSDLAYSYRNKADLLLQFDRAEEASAVLEAIEELFDENNSPQEDREILNSQYGILYQIRGDYKKSRGYFEKCIDAAEKSEGETRNKDISTACSNMARMLVDAGDFFEAYDYIKRAINAEDEDANDSDQIICYSTLAAICTELMNAGFGTTYVQEGYDAFMKVIKFRKEKLGNHHADTAVIYHDFAYFWYIAGDYDKALKYNEMARSIEEELFAEYSITRMRSLNTKALVVWEQGKHQDADDIFEYIITTSEQMSSDYLPDVADFLFNYARCLHDQDEDEKAKAQYLKCINIWSEMSEDGNRKLALAHQEIADIFFSENNAADALEHYVLAEKFNAEDFYVEVDVLDSVAACLLLLDKPEEGIQKFKELLEILVKYKANDTEAKFQLCNNLFCIIDAESEEEIELREMLMEQIKDEPATVEYVHNFLTNREEK